MWLTQPGPHCWRPCTRATVCASPASTARRRSGPSALATERVAAQRVRPADGACAARRRRRARGDRPRSPASAGARASTAAQLARRVAASSAAPVGFCPRGVMIAARAPRASAALELAGQHPALVDARPAPAPGRARAAGRTARRSRGSRRRPGRPGAGAPPSTRSMPSSAPLTTHSALARGCRPRAAARARAPSSSGHSAGGSPYRRTGSSSARQRALQVGQQRRVGVAAREVAGAGRHRQQRAR